MVTFQQRSPCDLVSGVRDTAPSYQLLIKGSDPGTVSAPSLWLYSRLVRSLLDDQGNEGERLILMPDFRTEDIQASVHMMEALETETFLVFNGNNKVVLETLGIPLQNHKPLENRVETISEEDEDDHPNSKSQELDEDIYNDKEVEEIQKLFLDVNNSILEDSDYEDQDEEEENDFTAQLLKNQDISDSDSDSEELPVKKETNVEIDDFEISDFSDEEDDLDQNLNKSRELQEEDAETRNETKISKPADDTEEKLKEVKSLVKKTNNFFSCKSCDYTNRKKHLLTLHAETHVEGLAFSCKYCEKVCPTRFSLRQHVHKNHRQKKAPMTENIKQAEEVSHGQDQNKVKTRDDLDKEINAKVKRLVVKDEGGVLWKCRECNKTGQRSSIARHAETHLTGYSHFCPICDHKSTTRDALKTHSRLKHTHN